MTDSASKARYENLSHGLKVVESHLLHENRLTEALNNEIAQGVITTQQEAADWVFGTLLFRRIKAHPLFYGFSGLASEVGPFIVEKCYNSIEQLRKIGAIDVHNDGTFAPAAASTIMSRNFMDLQTMKSITKLAHDAGPHQLLHLLANCAKIQSPVRRSEKKQLNEAYKLIKYKLEGPQSKIRIQTPPEKVFVLLQAAIGGHHFEDFALRQEMSKVTEGAVRILTAVEEYSKEGSRHGHVLAQSLLLRRSIYHGIWGENNNVLKQIGGVTEDLAVKLRAVGICSFADATNASIEDISKACNMSPTFGNSLKAAAATILQCTLKLSSFTKEIDGRLNLVIKTERKGDGQLKHNQDNVKYSLLVFTDRSKGLLLSCDVISDESEVEVECPKKFGRAYIRLISNLVGLDEQVTVDGNDRIEKSAFSLSPKVAKSTTKSKKSQSSAKPSGSNGKRLFDSHRSAVSNVNDLRLHKKGKLDNAPNNSNECIEIDSDTEPGPSTVMGKQPARKKPVTPSPHPATKSSVKNDLTPMFRPQPASHESNTVTTSRTQISSTRNPYSSQKSSSRPMQSRSKWFKDKHDHKNVQQSAFHSPKENPFSTYAFDPNNIEKSIEAAAIGSKLSIESSIIPSNFSAHKSKHSLFRTPATKRKTSAASGRISSVGLLKQKAMELQNHHQMTPHNHDGVYRQKMVDGPSRQMQHYEDEHMHGERTFYNTQSQQSLAPSRYGMQKSFGIPNRPEFTQASYDYEPSFMHTQHFSQFDSSVSSARRSHGYGMNPSFTTQQSFMRGVAGQHMNRMVAPSNYDRPTSSAAYSNSPGLQRFSTPNNYADIQDQFHHNDHQFQPMMQEHEVFYYEPSMAMGPPQHHQNEHFGTFEYSFNGLDPVERGVGYQYTEEHTRSGEFQPEEFNDFNIQPTTRHTTAVRNPYSQSKPMAPMPSEPPREIVTVTQNNRHAMDDASLAFDDAFL